MSRAIWRLFILAMVLLLGAVPAHAQRPDPHSGGSTPHQPVATAVNSPEVAGCELVVPYTRDLYSEIDDSGAFADFFYSDADFGDVSASEAKDIIGDGDVLIDALHGLDVPPAYADAHKGIIAFLQFQIDTARFYGLDTSVVPDIAGQDRAFVEIEAGEIALAKACPEEIEQVGGFILLDPSTQQDTPEDPKSPAN